MPMGKGLRRAVCALCLLALGFSVLPLYGMTGITTLIMTISGFPPRPIRCGRRPAIWARP